MTVTSGTEVDVFKPLYCHSLATVNTTTTLNNSVLTVAGNIYTTAIQVGNYSTSSLQGASLNTGIVQIANSGNMLGPHLATYTNVDNYPIFQNLSWQHDNAAIGWDCYYDGTTFRTSSSTTGYQIYKLSGQLRFNNCNSSGAGNTTTAYTDLCIGIGTVFVCATTSPSGASNAFEVNGNMYASGAIYGTGGGISVAIGNPICYINTSGVFTSTAFGSTYANYMFIGGRARFTQCDIFSDKSLKKNVRERDGAKDLELLMKVPMKEYEYIDKREHPDDNHVGVIAQEVEKIPELKHLVKHHKGYIPDYFNTVDIVEINDETFTIIGGVHYPDDTRIRFFYEKDGVEETAHGIIKDGNISHKHERLNCSRIFLYGREIQDVKSVNYNHIHNLTTSSVQELYRIMQALADTVSSQQKQIDTLKKYLTYSK